MTDREADESETSAETDEWEPQIVSADGDRTAYLSAAQFHHTEPLPGEVRIGVRYHEGGTGDIFVTPDFLAQINTAVQAHAAGQGASVTAPTPVEQTNVDLVARVEAAVLERPIPAFPNRQPMEWHQHGEHQYSGDCAWCRHDHASARRALIAAILEEAGLAEVTAERDRYRAALERIAEDGGGLDEFLHPETLQRIAREALGGEA